MLNWSKIRVVSLLLAALGTGWYARQQGAARQPEEAPESTDQPLAEGDPAQQAFAARSRDRVIAVTGVVERILADDHDGSPHQRLIIRTTGGISLLVAHNLDLAPRLQGIAPGDRVSVRGEYEWNEKGGVMHWTHDDPQGRHAAGYIEWRGQRYQ